MRQAGDRGQLRFHDIEREDVKLRPRRDAHESPVALLAFLDAPRVPIQDGLRALQRHVLGAVGDRVAEALIGGGKRIVGDRADGRGQENFQVAVFVAFQDLPLDAGRAVR